MKIATGHSITKDEVMHDFDSVRFVAEDGRTMFEVHAGKDGRSIEVRAPECCRVGGVLYAGILELRPSCSNAITIRTPRYEDA